MKNLWNWGMSTWEVISRMTLKQQAILIGSIILPGGSLILIFSRSGRQTIRKLVRVKTTRTYGKWISLGLTDEEIYKDLTNNID